MPHVRNAGVTQADTVRNTDTEQRAGTLGTVRLAHAWLVCRQISTYSWVTVQDTALCTELEFVRISF